MLVLLSAETGVVKDALEEMEQVYSADHIGTMKRVMLYIAANYSLRAVNTNIILRHQPKSKTPSATSLMVTRKEMSPETTKTLTGRSGTGL